MASCGQSNRLRRGARRQPKADEYGRDVKTGRPWEAIEMKLLRYGDSGQEKPGLLDASGTLRDLSNVVDDVAGDALSAQSLARLRDLDHDALPIVSGSPRLGPPVGAVGKVVAIGLNYTDHVAELGVPTPPEPIMFMKATTAICGPYDNVLIPPAAEKTDWEVELAVVIGRLARRMPTESAMEHVAGYMVANDISERAYQLEHGGQWVKGKSCDTFCPLGPWLVTIDEISDPQGLGIWLELNGEMMQVGNTERMIFPVAHLVSYVSRFMTLLPGDVILTGTPPGVGHRKKPPRLLKTGDVMRLGIDGLGEQRLVCAA
jgi:2-keto-4-pentenoate hydratase/2-oxohepta-3-ene-1,7-dioic acid hydratase in catechol pathway